MQEEIPITNEGIIHVKICIWFLPAFIIYNDRLVPQQFGGYTTLMFVTMKEKYKGVDTGLLYHELTHVKRLYRTLFLHPILYYFSEKYRLKSEVEAYKEQLKFYEDKESNIYWMVDAIATKYDICSRCANRKEIEKMLRS